ncbi:enoyl-CoA hydratase/carnithine racemase [Actinocorallia herbida]|uniref:Enoyl-CoA hydratase/carnithine racemase n=1 Tax=Actinocorallia herbida TaxID=58109 RepID=A0A3N1CZI7_9ACTN|nr:enoyl-CoA hydratase/isomerase family protein [Actinocorallia herbida]ROO86687.1 enoyl-CoA hydratase/carnithine racemase [Actinocorallia herbida]
MTTFDPLFRTRLDQYAPHFGEFFKLRFEDGILEVRMHTKDGPLRWGGGPHRQLIPLLQAIDHDEDVEVVIITGTGDTFNAAIDTDEYRGRGMLERWDNWNTGYDLTYRDQVREPMALLGLQVPVIAAINGPVLTHAELALLNDIVICSDTTVFSDGHWDGLGIVPGDGVHTVFRELLGHNRGRYFLYSGQVIDAREALALGLVGEVLPADQVLERAWQIAREWFMTKSRVQRRLARATLIQPWRELFVKEIAFGMAHECLGAAIGPPAPLSGPLREAFGIE